MCGQQVVTDMDSGYNGWTQWAAIVSLEARVRRLENELADLRDEEA